MNVDWTKLSRAAFNVRLTSFHRQRQFEDTKGYAMPRVGGRNPIYAAHYKKRYGVSPYAPANFRGSRRMPSRTAVVANQLVRRLMRNTEKKYRFRTVIQNNISTTAAVSHVTQIAAGDLQTERSGNKVILTGLYFHGKLSHDSSSANSTVRLLVVQDKRQVADGIPTAADILEESTEPLSYLRGINKGRFRVIKDIMVTTDEISKKTYMFRWSKRMNTQIKYNGIALTDIERNGIYFLQLSDEAVNFPVLRYTFLYTFTDL